MITISFIYKVKGFLLSPTATFERVKDDTLRDALTYAFIWFAICGVLFGLITSVFYGGVTFIFFFLPDWVDDLSFALIPIIAPLFGFFGVIVILIAGLCQQLWVYIFGGRKGFTQTAKAISYGATHFYLLGWIPYIGGLIGFIGTLIVTIIGLRELHEISTGRTLVSCLLAMVSFYILFCALVLLIVLLAYL